MIKLGKINNGGQNAHLTSRLHCRTTEASVYTPSSSLLLQMTGATVKCSGEYENGTENEKKV